MSTNTAHDDEQRPLLNGHDSHVGYDATSPAPNTFRTNTNQEISRKDFAWILLGLWLIVFLGALDGTVVATLLTPIGSYFRKSNQATYLGTSYLLSVCCFTPLYGRLSDILYVSFSQVYQKYLTPLVGAVRVHCCWQYLSSPLGLFYVELPTVWRCS
jgi:hypothetical protein